MGRYASFYTMTPQQVFDMISIIEREKNELNHIGDVFDITDPFIYFLNSEIISEDEYPSRLGLECCIYKAWYSLDWFFTQENKKDTFPENFIRGGRPFLDFSKYVHLCKNFADEETPLFIGRWFDSSEVKQIHEFLLSLDPDKMRNLLECLEEEQLDSLTEKFHKLRDFFREIARIDNYAITKTH